MLLLYKEPVLRPLFCLYWKCINCTEHNCFFLGNKSTVSTFIPSPPRIKSEVIEEFETFRNHTGNNVKNTGDHLTCASVNFQTSNIFLTTPFTDNINASPTTGSLKVCCKNDLMLVKLEKSFY